MTEVVVGETVLSTHYSSVSKREATEAAEKAAATLRAAGLVVEIVECEA